MNFKANGVRMLKGLIYALQQSAPCSDRKVRSIVQKGELLILNLHRIAPRDASSYAPLDPQLFEDLLLWLKQRFDLVCFDDLANLPAAAKPRAIISFDDGYKDFIEYAVPILAKHGVRVNHNIVPAVTESGRPPMNVTIQDFIGMAPAALLREVPLPGLPNGADPERREKSGLLASAAFKTKPIAEQKQIFRDLDLQFARFDGFRETPVMTLEDVKQIAGLHELGAHSFEHATMTAETDEYFEEDTRKCQEYFSNNLGIQAKVYAFPNGNARQSQIERARQAGFDHILLVGEDYSRDHYWLHHRFTIYGQSRAEVRARSLGWFKRPSRGGEN